VAEKILSAEQLQQLIDAHLTPDAPGGTDRHLSLALRTSAVVEADVAIIARRRGVWFLRAQAPSHSHFQYGPEAAGSFNNVIGNSCAEPIRVWTDADANVWTLLGLQVHPPTIVAIHGDWMLSSRRLSLWARDLSAMWTAGTAAARARSRLLMHRFTRSLSRADSLEEVCRLIVRSMARSVGARLAAVAVPTTPQRHLAIIATYGYSLELVRHLRIKPGTGIIGSVFESGRPLRGSAAATVPDWQPRPRYRTDSFVALPIRSGRETLGVLCVTDRIDHQSFMPDDVSTLRAFAAPAALAIARENALSRMRQFAHGAAIDPVSGTFNRRHFQARMEEELQRSRRDGLMLALLMIDIDDFKTVNDSFGHLVGDLVIKDVAEILRRSVRVFDVCARFGGEEFAVLMPGSSIESAAKVAARIRERIEAYRPVDRSLESVHVTVSVGLAALMSGMSASDLIAGADAALYVAKREGKNRLRIFPLVSEPLNVPYGSDGS
jgi:diguanylate cyclase (GGDEF)-like protein